ncbi:MAG: NUDIX domain-containing protein [Bacteroidetes bacterium]|nr:NUDIX domain-containing protein [Bacteroidota bacterium]MBS1933520.1 NUDIX domain-containing protein [Bacteroidota bacterium]
MRAITVQVKKLFTAGLVVVNQGKLLLAFSNNKQAWYLPGGKIDNNETAVEALIREIREELNIELNEPGLKFYIHISATAFGEVTGIIMEQDCFLYELKETPRPSAEIKDIRYFNCYDYSFEEKQVPGVIMILEKLKKDGLVK